MRYVVSPKSIHIDLQFKWLHLYFWTDFKDFYNIVFSLKRAALGALAAL